MPLSAVRRRSAPGAAPVSLQHDQCETDSLPANIRSSRRQRDHRAGTNPAHDRREYARRDRHTAGSRGAVRDVHEERTTRTGNTLRVHTHHQGVVVHSAVRSQVLRRALVERTRPTSTPLMSVVVRTVDITDPPVRIVIPEVRHPNTRISLPAERTRDRKNPQPASPTTTPHRNWRSQESRPWPQHHRAPAPSHSRTSATSTTWHWNHPHPPPRSPDRRRPHDQRTTAPRRAAPFSRARPRQQAAARRISWWRTTWSRCSPTSSWGRRWNSDRWTSRPLSTQRRWDSARPTR